MKNKKEQFYKILDNVLLQYEISEYNNIDINKSKLVLSLEDYIALAEYLIFKVKAEPYTFFYFDTINGFTFEDTTYTLHFYTEYNKYVEKDEIKIVLNNEFLIEYIDFHYKKTLH